MPSESSLPAGDFSTWLFRTRCSLEKQTGMEVPCGECTACCTSSYFVHIRPEETRTLARIPDALLFPAPGLPKGTQLLGYDEQGHCPLFSDGRCSIYEDRPLTCRSYDCRLFAAAGIDAGEEDRALINERVHLWKFDYPGKIDRDLHAAIRTAAQFLRRHADLFPSGVVPINPTPIALLALKVHDVFLGPGDEFSAAGHARPAAEIVRAIRELLDRRPTPISQPR